MVTECVLFRRMMSTRRAAGSARRTLRACACKCTCPRAGHPVGMPCAPQKPGAGKMKGYSMPLLLTAMWPCTASVQSVCLICFRVYSLRACKTPQNSTDLLDGQLCYCNYVIT